MLNRNSAPKREKKVQHTGQQPTPGSFCAHTQHDNANGGGPHQPSPTQRPRSPPPPPPPPLPQRRTHLGPAGRRRDGRVVRLHPVPGRGSHRVRAGRVERPAGSNCLHGQRNRRGDAYHDAAVAWGPEPADSTTRGYTVPTRRQTAPDSTAVTNSRTSRPARSPVPPRPIASHFPRARESCIRIAGCRRDFPDFPALPFALAPALRAIRVPTGRATAEHPRGVSGPPSAAAFVHHSTPPPPPPLSQTPWLSTSRRQQPGRRWWRAAAVPLAATLQRLSGLAPAAPSSTRPARVRTGKPRCGLGGAGLRAPAEHTSRMPPLSPAPGCRHV
jgi:hypothetical protein